MKRTRIPTIIAILIITTGISIATFLSQQKNIFSPSAKSQNSPKDVKISNITESSFTVTWTTKERASGSIKWDESKSSQKKIEIEETKTNGYTHSVTIRNLKPSTPYYFKIVSGESVYDNNSQPWEVTTAPEIKTQQESADIRNFSGSIVNSLGTPVTSALVFIEIEGVSPISTFTSENGTWVIPVNNIRKKDLKDIFIINGNEIVNIFVQGGPEGISSAQIYAQNATATPIIKLGETHDFKNIKTAKDDASPQSEIQTPQELSAKPKFNINEDNKNYQTQDNITIESVKDGEILNTTNPEFFGRAPSGKEIIISVESENPQSTTISADKNGIWRWSPPQGLASGEHKITISYRDENGILKTITKFFTVQAAETGEPAFEATPSASLTPAPTLTASPSAQKTISPSATPSQPVSGVNKPTLILFSLGILLFLGSGILFFSN